MINHSISLVILVFPSVNCVAKVDLFSRKTKLLNIYVLLWVLAARVIFTSPVLRIMGQYVYFYLVLV